MDSVIIFCAKYLVAVIPLIALVAIYQASPKHRRALVASLVVAVVLAAILDKLSAKLYYDPRPFVSHNVKPLISHVADNGFPSEHTLFSITIGTVLYLYRRRLGLVTLLISLVIGVARVAAHVHSPIDILGGIILGLAAGWAGKAAAEKFLTTKS